MNQKLSKRKITGLAAGFILSILIGIVFLFPVPYYVMEPGDAMDVEPFVQVDTPPKDENGKFYLTTISLKEASVIDYIFARFSKQMELIPKEQILPPGLSDEEYEQEQMENMLLSQNNALVSAFRYTQKPVHIETIGLEVFRLVNGVKNGLKPGDIIQQVNGNRITTVESLASVVAEKKPGEKVSVTLLRKGKPLTLQVPLIELPSNEQKGQKRMGFGFIPLIKTKITTEPKAKIETENIGGPSAGLMFTLETIDQLLPENLTNGYQVAGTGTIDENGKVGQIGGIKYKVIAADKKGVHIFFTPKDLTPQDQNEKIAKKTAKEIGSDMEIVPVANVQEAIDYLRKKPYYPAPF